MFSLDLRIAKFYKDKGMTGLNQCLKEDIAE